MSQQPSSPLGEAEAKLACALDALEDAIGARLSKAAAAKPPNGHAQVDCAAVLGDIERIDAEIRDVMGIVEKALGGVTAQTGGSAGQGDGAGTGTGESRGASAKSANGQDAGTRPASGQGGGEQPANDQAPMNQTVNESAAGQNGNGKPVVGNADTVPAAAAVSVSSVEAEPVEAHGARATVDESAA